jgi:hypothetical protein
MPQLGACLNVSYGESMEAKAGTRWYIPQAVSTKVWLSECSVNITITIHFKQTSLCPTVSVNNNVNHPLCSLQNMTQKTRGLTWATVNTARSS